MNLIAIKDLKQPRRLKERRRNEHELLLTSDGQPVANLVHLDTADDPEAVIRSIRDARSRLALSRIREAAGRGGTSRLTLAEINREVEAVCAANVQAVLASLVRSSAQFGTARTATAKPGRKHTCGARDRTPVRRGRAKSSRYCLCSS